MRYSSSIYCLLAVLIFLYSRGRNSSFFSGKRRDDSMCRSRGCCKNSCACVAAPVQKVEASPSPPSLPNNDKQHQRVNWYSVTRRGHVTQYISGWSAFSFLFTWIAAKSGSRRKNRFWNWICIFNILNKSKIEFGSLRSFKSYHLTSSFLYKYPIQLMIENDHQPRVPFDQPCVSLESFHQTWYTVSA